MKINDRSSIEFSKERQAELYPIDETYEMIDRWIAIHQEAQYFSYDEEAIINHDWNKMYNLFHEGSESDNITLNENNLELYHYLLNETIDKIIPNR